jgi:hypothetical protein
MREARSSRTPEASETTTDGGVEVERARQDAIAGAGQDDGLIAQVAAVRGDRLSMR